MATSAFLWKAAVSTIGVSSQIASNLLLRCKNLQSASIEGIKQSKLNQTSICHYCGNPWSSGNYKEIVNKKRGNTKRIQHLLKKESEDSHQLSKFEKNLLREFKSPNLDIKCMNCKKITKFAINLPPKAKKFCVKPTLPGKRDSAASVSSKKKKKCKKDPTAGLILTKTNNSTSNLSKTTVNPQKPTPLPSVQKNAQKTKSRLHAIFKNLDSKPQENRGSLQDFLSSL